jgi:hypothetical protein
MKATADVDLTAIVLGLQAEVTKLKARVHRLEKKDQAEKVRALFSRLLPAIGGRYGDNAWTVSEILADKVLREVAGNISPDKLGSLLSRAGEDHIDMTLSVEKIGKDHNKTLYKLTRKN